MRDPILLSVFGKHGKYAVRNWARDSLKFNSKDNGELGDVYLNKGRLFHKLRRNPDVVSSLNKSNEAL